MLFYAVMTSKMTAYSIKVELPLDRKTLNVLRHGCDPVKILARNYEGRPV